MTIDPKPMIHAVVIRADGTVPFDDSVPEENRLQTIGWLFDQGHAMTIVAGTRHVKITNWKKDHAHG